MNKIPGTKIPGTQYLIILLRIGMVILQKKMLSENYGVRYLVVSYFNFQKYSLKASIWKRNLSAINFIYERAFLPPVLS